VDTPVAARAFVAPMLAVAAFALLVLNLVAFDQGAMASLASDAMADSGGVLHELFHDARHLLGVPCH
jgi:hypothetical protein